MCDSVAFRSRLSSVQSRQLDNGDSGGAFLALQVIRITREKLDDAASPAFTFRFIMLVGTFYVIKSYITHSGMYWATYCWRSSALCNKIHQQ